MMNDPYCVENTKSQNELYDELAKFNWGAFFLNIFWAIPNGALKDALPTLIIMLIVLLLSQIPLLGLIFVILNICLAVYLGKKVMSGLGMVKIGRVWMRLLRLKKLGVV